MYKIMLVEDDFKLRQLIAENLERYGYVVTAVDDFKNVEQEFEATKPDLVILDVTLPYYDGFYLCRIMRRKTTIPIIIVSARDSHAQQLMGLELGADDYVTKPFDIELLMAKVRAALRRAYGEYAETLPSRRNLCVGGLALDEGSFRLAYGDETVELTKNEYKIIKILMENVDRIVSREDLLIELWDDSSFVDDNTLTVNMTRVKTKLEQLGVDGAIKTKRRSGYMLDRFAIEVEKT